MYMSEADPSSGNVDIFVCGAVVEMEQRQRNPSYYNENPIENWHDKYIYFTLGSCRRELGLRQ